MSVFKKGKRHALSGLDLFINTSFISSTHQHELRPSFHSVILLFESLEYHSLITLLKACLLICTH